MKERQRERKNEKIDTTEYFVYSIAIQLLFKRNNRINKITYRERVN